MKDEKAQQVHIRATKGFAAFVKHSPDMATSEELRAYQLHMADTGITPSTFNARIVALRFFFGMTCGRDEMKRYMQFRTEPRRLPVVFSIEEVSDILMAAPGPGLKYRAALSISYGAGLRSAEVCNLKIGDIDSNRMLIHVEQGKGKKDRKVMLSPGLLTLLRQYWREARPDGWLFPGRPRINPISPRPHLGQEHGGGQEGHHATHPAPYRDGRHRGRYPVRLPERALPCRKRCRGPFPPSRLGPSSLA